MDLKCYLGRKLLLLQPIPQWAIEQIITNIYQTSKKKSAQVIFRLKDLNSNLTKLPIGVTSLYIVR